MKKIPKQEYTAEFKELAVNRVTAGQTPAAVARELGLIEQTLRNWVKAAKAGKLGAIGQNYRPLTEIEIELARTKKELVEVKMERDILKKAAAYFAKESLPGTRR